MSGGDYSRVNLNKPSHRFKEKNYLDTRASRTRGEGLV